MDSISDTVKIVKSGNWSTFLISLLRQGAGFPRILESRGI